MAIYEEEIAEITTVADNAAELDTRLMKFAEVLHHEARHCQQTFWMMAPLRQHRGDYAAFSQIETVYQRNTQPNIYQAVESIKIPNDSRVLTDLHRTLMFHYYWMISDLENQAGVNTSNPTFRPRKQKSASC